MRISVIGDSFVRQPNPNDVPQDKTLSDCWWIQLIKDKFVDADFFIDGLPSRNVQSIIDNWIKLIPTTKDEDVTILILPYFARTRLPKKSPEGIHDDKNNFVYFDRFIGTLSYVQAEYCELEYWENDHDQDHMYKLMIPQEIINSSDASFYNWIEVIESLKKLTKGKVLIFCWDNLKIKTDLIEDKEIITKNIGYWESFDDLFKKTDGNDGMRGNLHWSFPYNVDFGKYVLTKF
jgi:hypothetical protein